MPTLAEKRLQLLLDAKDNVIRKLNAKLIEKGMGDLPVAELLEKELEEFAPALEKLFGDSVLEITTSNQKALTDLMEKMMNEWVEIRMSITEGLSVKVANFDDNPLATEVIVSNLKDLPAPKVTVQAPAFPDEAFKDLAAAMENIQEEPDAIRFERNGDEKVITVYATYPDFVAIYEFKRNARGNVIEIIRTIQK